MKDKIIFCLPPEHPWRDSVIYYESVDSTNIRAKALASSGAPEGTVVIANAQTAGRGRLGRSFQSPAGSGIYLSLILCPHCPPSGLMHLTCAVAVAVCDAVEAVIGCRPGIKWINDLVVNGKKLAGILTELSIDPKSGLVDYAVIGVGINCTQLPKDFPSEIREIACSAAMITGKSIDRSLLATAMITELEKMNRALLTEKERIMERYRQDCVTIGAEVTVIQNDTRRCGKALGVDGEGALIVAFSDGRTESVNSGEVSVRGLYGYT